MKEKAQTNATDTKEKNDVDFRLNVFNVRQNKYFRNVSLVFQKRGARSVYAMGFRNASNQRQNCVWTDEETAPRALRRTERLEEKKVDLPGELSDSSRRRVQPDSDAPPEFSTPPVDMLTSTDLYVDA